MDTGIEFYAIGKYASSVLLRTPCLNTETHYHYLSDAFKPHLAY
jgi:hypothetical protein